MTHPPPGTPTSPYVVYHSSDRKGNEIRLTVTFGADFIITSCTADRDPACAWRNILFGLGISGSPDDTLIAIRNIPPGRGQSVPISQLNALGLFTIQDILSKGQVTAN